MSVAQIIIVAALIGVALWLVSSYNRLVALRGHLQHAFGQIDVPLRRRFGLIAELVESARRHIAPEGGLLQAVVDARDHAWKCSRAAALCPGDLNAMSALSGASGMLAEALAGLLAQVESCPPLQADAAMVRLSEELTTTENRIAFARQAYNDSVTDYNLAIGQFPVNLVAGIFRLSPSQPLQSCECPIRRGPVRAQY